LGVVYDIIDAIRQEIGDIGYNDEQIPKWPRGSKKLKRTRTVTRKNRRVALLTELDDLPSLYYHMTVIKGLESIDSIHNFETSIHNTTQRGLKEALANVIRLFEPDAVVLLRLTPCKGCMDVLTKNRISAILIHSDRADHYLRPPILANIIPRNDKLKTSLKNWLKKNVRGAKKPFVVVATVKREPTRTSV
jgi:hypothetical protein